MAYLIQHCYNTDIGGARLFLKRVPEWCLEGSTPETADKWRTTVDLCPVIAEFWELDMANRCVNFLNRLFE